MPDQGKFGHTDRAMLDGLLRGATEFLAALSAERERPCTSKYRGIVRTRMIEKARDKRGATERSLRAMVAEIEAEIKP